MSEVAREFPDGVDADSASRREASPPGLRLAAAAGQMLSDASSWLRISRLGMLVMALSIGFGAGRGRRLPIAHFRGHLAGHRQGTVRSGGQGREASTSHGSASGSSFWSRSSAVCSMARSSSASPRRPEVMVSPR